MAMANKSKSNSVCDIELPDKKMRYLSVTERYFTPRYAIGKKMNAEDHCILFHSNKIALLTLAPSHPVLRDNKIVSNVNFNLGKNMNRLVNIVRGKAKKGGQWLQPDAKVCELTCTDGSNYTIYSCIRGNLIEINENLLNNPSLLSEKPDSNGYIAVILPKLHESQAQQDSLLSKAEYIAHTTRQGEGDQCQEIFVKSTGQTTEEMQRNEAMPGGSLRNVVAGIERQEEKLLEEQPDS
ncbi:PREDICTED: protein Simiate-like isoform X2 [Priapulus caudatus]|uniref:Protein Abitram n=1 Tax=Priapulus caudatus TaxID=37621 RepID=A0ABM1DZV4_PRICU|nr:PREDICTED: protein Simiate-like isoform X2 [Priapulus caudatus]